MTFPDWAMSALIWFVMHAGWFLLALYAYTLIPLLREAMTNKSSYVMIAFLSALVATAWADTIWLDAKELMVVHGLIFAGLVIANFFFDAPRELFRDSIMVLSIGMIFTDLVFFLFGGYELYHLSIINGIFVLMCVITRISCTNYRQSKGIKEGGKNEPWYAMVKRYCFEGFRTH